MGTFALVILLATNGIGASHMFVDSFGYKDIAACERAWRAVDWYKYPESATRTHLCIRNEGKELTIGPLQSLYVVSDPIPMFRFLEIK